MQTDGISHVTIWLKIYPKLVYYVHNYKASLSLSSSQCPYRVKWWEAAWETLPRAGHKHQLHSTQTTHELGGGAVEHNHCLLLPPTGHYLHLGRLQVTLNTALVHFISLTLCRTGLKLDMKKVNCVVLMTFITMINWNMCQSKSEIISRLAIRVNNKWWWKSHAPCSDTEWCWCWDKMGLLVPTRQSDTCASGTSCRLRHWLLCVVGLGQVD